MNQPMPVVRADIEAPKDVTVIVKVNNHEVSFHDRKANGLQIKQTAINQGVPIQVDFALFEIKGPGHLKQIADQEAVTLHKSQEFRAVAPDDNS